MKKAASLIGIMSIVAFGAMAQFSGRYDERYSSRNPRYDERTDYGNNKAWGYDNDHNVVNGDKAMRIESYQRQALMRIHEGQRRGLITRREADRLMKFYRNIERKENKFMRNGRISRNEARELNNDLEHLNNMISKEKRDLDRNRRNRF